MAGWSRRGRPAARMPGLGVLARRPDRREISRNAAMMPTRSGAASNGLPEFAKTTPGA